MGSVCHEVAKVRQQGALWASVTALVLLAACGGRESPQPDSDMASADSAAAPAPAPTATDTAGAAASVDTGTASADTGKGASEATSPPKPTTPAAEKPGTTTKPAEKPATPRETAAPKPAPAAQAQDTADTQTTAQASESQDTTRTQDTASAQDTAATQDTQQTADAPLRDPYHQPPKDTVDAATYDGWKQYNLNCARCHGEDVLGTTIAPHLVQSLKPDGPIPTEEAFTQVVCAGRPEKGMPAWCALGMEPATIKQIYSYVKGRSEGKIGPGRPARRGG